MEIQYVWGLAAALGIAALAATLEAAKLAYMLKKEREEKDALERELDLLTEQTEKRIADSVKELSSKASTLEAARERLTARAQKLKLECEHLKDWSEEKGRYKRTEIAKGLFA